MEEMTDSTMQDIHGDLPLDGDSLKRKRDETKKGTTSGEQQYYVEGEPVVAKPRLENSQPDENELTDPCGEAGQNADPIMGGEGLGENPEKIESKVDAGDREHVTADSKEKEEQVNAQGGEEGMKIDKEKDSEISQVSAKMTEKKESEENGQVDAPGNEEEGKCEERTDELVIEKPTEVESFEEKKISETCREPVEVEGFTGKKESESCGEPMEVEEFKEGGDQERTVETEKGRKDNVGELCNIEADEVRQAGNSQAELVSRNNREVEKDAKGNTGEPCKPEADEIMQAGAAKEDEEVPEIKSEVEESRREVKAQTDTHTQGEDLMEFPGDRVELEQSGKEETGKSFEVEAEKLRQAEDSGVPVENIETDNNSTREDTEELCKTESDELTQAEGSQEEEIPDSKVEPEDSKEENSGEPRKTKIDEFTKIDGSQDVSGNKVQIGKRTKENVEEHSKTEMKKLPQAKDSREEIQEATVDTDRSTKEDTVEWGMTKAVESAGADGSEEKGLGECQAGNETITKEDPGESYVLKEEALKPIGTQDLEKKGPGEDEAGSSGATGRRPLTEVRKLTDSGVWGSLERGAESREEPLVAEDFVEEKNVECASNIGPSTEEDRHQSSGNLQAEGSVKVEYSQNETHSTEEPMEVEIFSGKEEADERSVNTQEGKEDVITSPMELEHVGEKDENSDRVAIVLKGTDDVILGPVDVAPSREMEDGAEGVANAQKYTEDVIAGPMDLGYSSRKEDAEEVKKFEKGAEDATAGPMEVHQSRKKEVTKETTDVEKGTEDVTAAPLEEEQTKEVQDPQKVGQDPKEEAALTKSTEDVTVGPDKEADINKLFATDAEQEHAVKPGKEDGEEEEALDPQKEETEEKEATNESSDEKSETGTDRDAMSSPTPTRKKPGRRSVAPKAAERQKVSRKPPRNPERVESLKKMETLEEMKKILAEHGRSEKDYKVGDIIEVDDLMQTDYEYKLEAPVGKDFAEGFNPRFTPKEMLELGIFEGKVINDCIFEFPREWYEGAVEKEKLCPQGPDDSVNYFKVKSPSKEGRKKGWLPRKDPHGWFQWYCRYYLGRRLEPDDSHQMSRWRQMRRQAGQIKKYCEPGDLSCRAKQRQTLLNWSHDCFM